MTNNHGPGHKIVYIVQEFSIPLILGVVVALVMANVAPKTYQRIVHDTYSFVAGENSHDVIEVAPTAAAGSDQASDSGHHGLHHFLSLHFIINDLFMVLFFGIAAKEIAEACLPGGALNPVSKAINPLLGTIGGVVGPVFVYLLLNSQIGEEAWSRGWGIPTATDIALAWLVARLVFGNGHPAISFLLLLAVADDGIGLMIIAIFYPTQDPVWANALFIIPGMVIAYLLRKKDVKSWIPYIVIGGAFSWWGLFSAHLHPALALVPIVPFLPGPTHDEGLFEDDESTIETDTLNHFEHDLKKFVDFGLFFFAFANAGVEFSNINNLTWIVFLSLLVGKTVGITLFSWLGTLVKIPLPDGMKLKHLVVAGVIAGLGLTVALFVSGQAFKQLDLQGSAKMGALFSAAIAILAIVLGQVLGVKDRPSANK
ncbi:MAG: Na+/H+ antiporter NhaA [Pirellulaceae bacterium]